MHASASENIQRFINKYLEDKKDKELLILDVGSSSSGGSCSNLFKQGKWVYEGLDIHPDTNTTIVVSDPYHWKEVDSNKYDVVISTSTFEHIAYFWDTALEMARVLKQDGFCCIVAPSTGEIHNFPIDCYRFYPDGMKSIAKYANLNVLEAYIDPTDAKWNDCVLVCKKGAV